MIPDISRKFLNDRVGHKALRFCGRLICPQNKFYCPTEITTPTAFNFNVQVVPIWNCWNSLTESGE